MCRNGIDAYICEQVFAEWLLWGHVNSNAAVDLDTMFLFDNVVVSYISGFMSEETLLDV